MTEHLTVVVIHGGRSTTSPTWRRSSPPTSRATSTATSSRSTAGKLSAATPFEFAFANASAPIEGVEQVDVQINDVQINDGGGGLAG